MKRLLATLMLIVCLTLTVLAGHVMPSGAYCPGECTEIGKCSQCGQSCSGGGFVRTAEAPSDLTALAEALYYGYRVK